MSRDTPRFENSKRDELPEEVNDSIEFLLNQFVVSHRTLAFALFEVFQNATYAINIDADYFADLMLGKAS
jgi:hypothetical protein